MTNRSLFGFIAVLLTISWALQCALIYLVGDLDSPAGLPMLVALMFVPTILAVIYRFAVNQHAFQHVRFRVGNPLYLLLGVIIPAAASLAVLALAQALGLGKSEYFAFAPSGVDVLKGPWLLGIGSQSWLTFVLNVAVTAAAFAAMNSVATVGEEFCWRGFLQKPMIDRLGVVRGVGLLGLVWAFWHLPANLSGYNYPHAPVLGALVLFPLLLTAESFIMAWLTLRAQSFWPAVLMHGSINGIQEGMSRHFLLAENVSRLQLNAIELAVTMALGMICLLAVLRRSGSIGQSAAICDACSSLGNLRQEKAHEPSR